MKTRADRSEPKREAISYGRFSDRKQNEGDSTRRQREAFERVCERYADRCYPSTRYTFGQFFGKGESGYKAEHMADGGSLKAFFDALDRGDILGSQTVLVIEAFDRLGRLPPAEATGLLKEIVYRGCALAVHAPDVWIGSPEDLSGPNWMLISAMLMLAHMESQQKSRRIKADHDNTRERIRRGEKVKMRYCPCWLRKTAQGFEEIPENVAILKRIYQLSIDGEGGQLIAQRFNDEKVPVLGKKSTVWDQETVRFFLKTRTVLGEYQPQEFQKVGGKRKRVKMGEPVKGYYPAVIDEETYNRAQGCLAQRKGMRGRNPHTGVNIFRGILWDAASRTTMIIKLNRVKGKTYRYLVASRAKQDGKDWCSIPYDLIQAGFLAFVEELRVEPARDEDTSAAIEKETALIGELTARLERLNAEDDYESLLALVRKTNAAKKEAEERLDALKQRAATRDIAENVDDFAAFARKVKEHEAAGTLNDFLRVLRNRVRSIVSEMWCLPLRESRRTKTVLVQVFLRAGGHRWFVVKTTGKANYCLGTDVSPYLDPATDLRQYEMPAATAE